MVIIIWNILIVLFVFGLYGYGLYFPSELLSMQVLLSIFVVGISLVYFGELIYRGQLEAKGKTYDKDKLKQYKYICVGLILAGGMIAKIIQLTGIL